MKDNMTDKQLNDLADIITTKLVFGPKFQYVVLSAPNIINISNIDVNKKILLIKHSFIFLLFFILH